MTKQPQFNKVFIQYLRQAQALGLLRRTRAAIRGSLLAMTTNLDLLPQVVGGYP